MNRKVPSMDTITMMLREYELAYADLQFREKILEKIVCEAIDYIEEQSKFEEGCDVYKICNKDVLLGILKGTKL